jgi:dienelactone hydrolase
MRLIVTAVFLCACMTSSVSAATIQMRDIAVAIPISDPSGQAWSMRGHVCAPVDTARPRLAVINHGSPPNPSDRPGMKPESCASEVAVWFAQHGFASVFVMRLGYGETGGPWTEGYKTCSAADYAHAGLETARQIDAIVRGVQTLEGFDPQNMVVVGQSAGGWGTVAYAGMEHPNVAGLINMAGGRGGHYHNRPDSNCQPEHLVDAISQFGATARAPMLWIYSKNDSFFNPTLAEQMADAFRRAGGSMTFVAADPFEHDGHHLFGGHGGSRIWGPLFEKYFESVGIRN